MSIVCRDAGTGAIGSDAAIRLSATRRNLIVGRLRTVRTCRSFGVGPDPIRAFPRLNRPAQLSGHLRQESVTG